MLTRKKDGFEGQKVMAIPRSLLSQCAKNKIANSLYITDIGYYPKAKYHYQQRTLGVEQHILVYCIEGEGWVKIKSKQYQIKAGEFFIIPPFHAHKYGANEANPWTIYWIHFDGRQSNGLVDLLIKKSGGHKAFLHYHEQRIHLFDSIYQLLESGFDAENLLFVNMCFQYFLTTFIFHDKYNSMTRIPEQDAINRSIDLMSKKIDQMIPLEEIATSVNLSTSHFSALFKKKTGFSPIEYFNHLKVQKACQYLLFSDWRVKEIAFKLGVEDPYYFSRLFTKVMGMSPNEYREKRI